MLGRAHEVVLRREIDGVDNQRVAFPASSRVTAPLSCRRGEVRPAVERDHPRLVSGFHEQHDVRRRLHDLVVAEIAGAITTAETWNAPRDAAKGVVEILRAIRTPGRR